MRRLLVSLFLAGGLVGLGARLASLGLRFGGGRLLGCALGLETRRLLFLGHAFGLEHCIFFQCNMNGSNSLAETDRQPLRLCPVCLKKLQWNRGFDVLKRYDRLLAFFKKHGLQPEAEWTAARLQRIRTK